MLSAHYSSLHGAHTLNIYNSNIFRRKWQSFLYKIKRNMTCVNHSFLLTHLADRVLFQVPWARRGHCSMQPNDLTEKCKWGRMSPLLSFLKSLTDALGILQSNSLGNKQNCSVLDITLMTSMLLQRFTAGIIGSGFFPLPHWLTFWKAVRPWVLGFA